MKSYGMTERGKDGWHARATLLLRDLGFRVAHHKTGGRRLAPDKDTKGYFDLTVVGFGAYVKMELKRQGMDLAPEQVEWKRLMQEAGVECYGPIWPSDEPWMIELFTEKRRRWTRKERP